MDDLVVPHIQARMGIPLLVWNEFSIKVLVEAPDEDIPRLDYLHYLKNVIPSHYEWVWVIGEHWNQTRSEYLDLTEPGEELCPDAVKKLLHGSIIPQFFVMEDVPNPLDGKNGYLAIFCPASKPLM